MRWRCATRWCALRRVADLSCAWVSRNRCWPGAGAGASVRVDGALWRLPGDRGEMAAILRDVTVREERRTRQAMQAKTDAVRQLAAGIAHDFNNVLTTISTSSHLLLGEFDGDHRVGDTVAERSCRRRPARGGWRATCSRCPGGSRCNRRCST